VQFGLSGVLEISLPVMAQVHAEDAERAEYADSA
jgi:hypothetical protein